MSATSQNRTMIAEKSMLWITKCHRILKRDQSDDLRDFVNQKSISHVFEYFVRREAALKMAEERMANGDEQVFEVPFTVRQ